MKQLPLHKATLRNMIQGQGPIRIQLKSKEADNRRVLARILT